MVVSPLRFQVHNSGLFKSLVDRLQGYFSQRLRYLAKCLDKEIKVSLALQRCKCIRLKHFLSVFIKAE